MTQTTASSIPVTSIAATHLRTGPMIVAVGGADPRSVLRAARQLAPSMPGGVLAVSVVEPPPVYAAAGELTLVPPNLAAEGREAIATRLTGQVQEFADANVTWRTSVLDGDPSYALTELARSLNSPLIVMGIGRHRPVDRIMGVETSDAHHWHDRFGIRLRRSDGQGPRRAYPSCWRTNGAYLSRGVTAAGLQNPRAAAMSPIGTSRLSGMRCRWRQP